MSPADPFAANKFDSVDGLAENRPASVLALVENKVVNADGLAANKLPSVPGLAANNPARAGPFVENRLPSAL